MSRAVPSIDWQLVLGPLAESCPAAEWEQLSQATTQHPQRAIRLHPRRSIDELPFEVEAVPWCQQGYFLKSADIRPGEFLHFAAGDYYIQDAGSMLPLAISEITPGQWVCDTCASPGGKSTGALEQLNGTGLLVANEVIGSRLAILQLALARAGYGNYLVTNLDVDRLTGHMAGRFDCVLVDAPCTGQSMVVRGKQSLASYSATQIEHSSARQRRIIRAAAELVKPGGRLVYSTCTFSFAENEQIVQELAEEQARWQFKRFEHLQAWETPNFEGCYRLWPHRDGCAGAFAAALVCTHDRSIPADDNAGRADDNPGQTGWAAGRVHATQGHSSPGPKRIWTELAERPAGLEWLEEQTLAAVDNPPEVWSARGEQLHRFAADLPAEWLVVANGGVPVAERKGERLEPLYGSAVLQRPDLKHRLRIELEDLDAARYVAGEAIRFSSAESGWCLVCWRGRPLAWGKLAGGILKNHYPKAMRQARHP